MLEWFGDALTSFLSTEFGRMIGGALLVIVGFLLSAARRGGIEVIDYFQRLKRAEAAVAREQGPSGLREGAGLWLTQPILQPDHYGAHIAASRILNVAHLKGGVGKTTVAANLGAAFAARGARVLLIDLDFQGSLSAMARPRDWLPAKEQDSMASKLLSEDIAGDVLVQAAQSVARWEDFLVQHRNVAGGELKMIGSYYDLAQCENRLMIEWLVGARGTDPRYALARTLHSPAVMNAYDVIILDSPPRLSMGAVQALCACTHLLIPTILDGASASAVSSLVAQTGLLRRQGVAPHLRYAGVVGAMRTNGVAQTDTRRRLPMILEQTGEPIDALDESCDIPRAAAFQNALGHGIAYLVFPPAAGQNVREPFDRLADAVTKRMR